MKQNDLKNLNVKKKSLAVGFNSTIVTFMLTLTRYIQVNVESASYVSYQLTTNLYDKRDGLNFSTVNSLDSYLCSNVTFIAYIWSFRLSVIIVIIDVHVILLGKKLCLMTKK